MPSFRSMRKDSDSAFPGSGTWQSASWLTTAYSVPKWNAHDISFDDPCPVLKPHALGQFLRTRDTGWCQFNSSDIGSILMSEIPDSATKSRTKIRYACSARDLGSPRQFIRRCWSAVVIL